MAHTVLQRFLIIFELIETGETWSYLTPLQIEPASHFKIQHAKATPQNPFENELEPTPLSTWSTNYEYLSLGLGLAQKKRWFGAVNKWNMIFGPDN